MSLLDTSRIPSISQSKSDGKSVKMRRGKQPVSNLKTPEPSAREVGVGLTIDYFGLNKLLCGFHKYLIPAQSGL